MKTIFIILFLSFFIYSNSQEVILSGQYSSSSSIKFKTNTGFEIGYNQKIKRSNLGFFFSNLYNKSDYGYVNTSSVDGTTTYIRKYTPDNNRTRVNFLYSYNLINNTKSNLKIGLIFGLNYYHLKGSYYEIIIDYQNNITEERKYFDYKRENKIGYGINIEYEINEVIFKRISTFVRITTELSFFEKYGCSYTTTLWDVGWVDINLGIKYNLKKQAGNKQ